MWNKSERIVIDKAHNVLAVSATWKKTRKGFHVSTRWDRRGTPVTFYARFVLCCMLSKKRTTAVLKDFFQAQYTSHTHKGHRLVSALLPPLSAITAAPLRDAFFLLP